MSDWNFKEWYSENGNDLNKRRRSRYQTDPDYKDRVLRTNRASREKRRLTVQEETDKEKAAIKVKTPSKAWKEVDADATGNPNASGQTLLTIGALARALGKSVQVLRLWERKGLLEETPFRNAKGDRLYTPELVVKIHKNLEDKGKLATTFKPRILSRSVDLRVRLADGSERTEKFFTIGVFAAALGRSVVTMEQMERRGALPRTPFRTPKGHRVYNADMITVVKTALDSRGSRIRGEAWNSFREEVESGWTKALVVGARSRSEG